MSCNSFYRLTQPPGKPGGFFFGRKPPVQGTRYQKMCDVNATIIMMKYNDREGRQLEFKQTVSNTLLKTVTAYANYSTGKFSLDLMTVEW